MPLGTFYIAARTVPSASTMEGKRIKLIVLTGRAAGIVKIFPWHYSRNDALIAQVERGLNYKYVFTLEGWSVFEGTREVNSQTLME
jgi:hypothetical protein